MADKGCENCGNQFGFAFGTCCQCGWNDITKEYKFIQINPEHIADLNLRYRLIDRHDSFVIKRRPDKKENV